MLIFQRYSMGNREKSCLYYHDAYLPQPLYKGLARRSVFIPFRLFFHGCTWIS